MLSLSNCCLHHASVGRYFISSLANLGLLFFLIMISFAWKSCWKRLWEEDSHQLFSLSIFSLSSRFTGTSSKVLSSSDDNLYLVLLTQVHSFICDASNFFSNYQHPILHQSLFSWFETNSAHAQKFINNISIQQGKVPHEHSVHPSTCTRNKFQISFKWW